jgi:hypothetical protein
MATLELTSSCLGAFALLLGGCVVDHDLGGSAEGSSGTAADTMDPDGGPDGGPGGQTSTSGPTSDGSTGAVDTGDATATDTATATATDDGSTGEPPFDCEPSPDFVRWTPSDFVDPIPGVEASFAAVLGGPCTSSVLVDKAAEIPTWSVVLDCTLGGRVDGDPAAGPFAATVSLDFTSSMDDAAILGSLSTDVDVRIVADWWGMGWDRWVVVSRPDGTVVLDVADAQAPDPEGFTSWDEDLQVLLGGQAWHGDIGVGIEDTPCEPTDGECGEDSRRLLYTWDGAPAVDLETGQIGTFGTPVRELAYGVYVESAFAVPTPVCTDTPLGFYRTSMWAIEP